MRVIYHNRSKLDAAVEGELSARWVEKDALLRDSDHLVIVVPYSAGVAPSGRARPEARADEADRDAEPTSRALAASSTTRRSAQGAGRETPHRGPLGSMCSRASLPCTPTC